MSDSLAKKQVRDEDFKACLDGLQKSGERVRSNIYAFVLIFGAILLWALNAIVWPAEQKRLDSSQRKDASVIMCLNAPNLPGCSVILNGPSLTHRLEPGIDAATNLRKPDIETADLDYLKHEIQMHLDKSAEVAQFRVPLAGIISDRTWLWLVNAALGLFMFYLIRDSLNGAQQMLQFLCDRHEKDLFRLALLSTAQILTSSRKPAWPIIRYRPKILLIGGIFTLPIIVSILVLYDWYYLLSHPDPALLNHPDPTLPIVRPPTTESWWPPHWLVVYARCVSSTLMRTPANEEFISEPEFWGGIATIPVLFCDVVLCCSILRVLRRSAALYEKVNQDWKDAQDADARKAKDNEDHGAAASVQ